MQAQLICCMPVPGRCALPVALPNAITVPRLFFEQAMEEWQVSSRVLDVSNIEIRHLRYFLTVAEERHFSRAADKLGIAQPPLSQQIQRLEDLVGQRLLERRPQVRLTAAGEVLAEAARRLIGQFQKDLDDVRRTGSGHAGSLTIGFPASALVTSFPRAVRRFKDHFPDVMIVLQEMSSSAQIAALEDGAIDVGLVRGPVTSDRLYSQIIIEEPFVAVLCEGHPLAGADSLDLAELGEEDFVLFPRAVAPALYDELRSLFEEAGIDPRVTMEAREWLTIIGFVETGMGVTVAPASFHRLKWGDVCYVPLRNSRSTTSISVCAPLSRTNPITARFVDQLANDPPS